MRIALFAIAFATMFATKLLADEFGYYRGRVVAEWLGDGRTMKLLEDFSYFDPGDEEWDAQLGAIVDGASIPRFAWTIIGGPFEGKYRDASVIHDVACDKEDRPWPKVHRAFYTGMLASGVGVIKAKIMYAAVYHFGPRWPLAVTEWVDICDGDAPNGVQLCKRSANTLDQRVPVRETAENLTEFRFLEQLIELRENSASPLTLEQIEQFGDWRR